MKKLMALLCLLLGLCGFARAEGIMDEEINKTLRAAYPGYEIMVGDQWGNAAAAVMARGDERILCVVEKYNDLWRVVIDNPAALHQGETPYVLMDSDIALFWGYGDGRHYSCSKSNGLWGTVQCAKSGSDGNVHWEVQHTWKDGLLQRTEWRTDENDNVTSTDSFCPVPAAWLKPYARLANFDCTVFPLPGEIYSGWLSQEALKRCAAEIVPEGTLVEGSAGRDGLELLMDMPDGRRVMVNYAQPDGGPVTSYSAPLPEGTTYGCENFTTVLNLPTGLLASIAHNGDGTWRVDYVWPNTAEGTPVFMGREWLAERLVPGEERYVGDHPWGDLSAIDWLTLPASMEEAMARLDASRWAVVNNPDPADRLHLRERDEKSSRSLGKYYNGTHVEVLKRGETWTKVRVAGNTVGWMMTKYLAFGADAWQVKQAFPQLHLVENTGEFYVRQRPEMSAAGKGEVRLMWRGESEEIIGVVGDEWYHVWFPDTSEGGYMKQSDFWPGNG